MSHRDCEMPVLAKHPPRIVIPEQLNRNVLILNSHYLYPSALSLCFYFLFIQ